MVRALEAAARRGAHVTVRLEGRPHPDSTGAVALQNVRAIQELRRCGADAQLTAPGQPFLHLKAAVCDGETFLDDRNFPDRGDTIVCDDAHGATRAVLEAAAGKAQRAARGLWTDKQAAMRQETRLIESAAPGTAICVSTESLGFCDVYGALKRLARSGVECDLIVARSDVRGKNGRAAMDLQAAGVHVRVAAAAEKVAIAGGSAWIGSANATYASEPTLDWGLRTSQRRVVRTLQERFNAQWRRARAYRSS